MESLKAFLNELNKPLFLLNLIFVIFFILLLDRYPAMWFDEGYFSNPAYNLANGNGLVFSTYQNLWGFNVFVFDKGPIFYLLLAFVYKIFGFGLIQGRVLSVAFGIFGLNVFYFYAREFVSRKTSLFITILFGTIPIYFIAAREIRMEIVYAVFDLISFYFLVRYFKTEKKFNRYIVYAAIFSALSLLTHPNGAINIVAFIVCLVFFNIKLTFKGILSKQLLLSIKESLKAILIYAIIIGLIAFPYVVIIILNYNVYVAQSTNLLFFSTSSILSNIFQQYEQFKTFFYSFGGTSLPLLLRVVIIIVVMGIVVLSLITLFIRSYDDPYIKIAFLYALISAVLLCIIINHKNDVYITIYLPQLIIGLGLLIERAPSRFSGLSGWYRQTLMLVDRIKSIFQKGLKKKITVPVIICLAFIGINVYSCGLAVYENRNCDPNLVRTDLLAFPVELKPTDRLLGDTRFWIPLHDYSYTDYGTFVYGMYFNNETFNSILNEVKPTIILYDKNWRSGDFPYAASLNATFIAGMQNYIRYNCKLLTTINITSQGTAQFQQFFPIEVYATSFR
jgi:hypothetical protein